MLAITLDNLSKIFPASSPVTLSPGHRVTPPAVDSLSLTIPAGSLFFLLGPSGCGKTTLLRMIAGFTTPTSGRILFGTRDISNVPAHQRDTGMVFQSYALWPHMTVAQNVAFGLAVRKIKNPDRDRRVHEALALVQMDTYHDRRPNQLSGGQQQRIALARALAIRPQCLLLDEPLSNLDAKLRADMRTELRRIIKAAGITALYVTHDQKEALSMADHIALMRQGRLEQVGTPAELYRQPASRFVADFIGESNFIPGTVESVTVSSVIVKTSAGLFFASPHPPTYPTTYPPTYPPGTPVILAIRPESVTLSPPLSPPAPASSAPNLNCFTGKLFSSTYLGDTAEHLISLPGLPNPIKSLEINPQFTPAAVDVIVQIHAHHIMLLGT